ncbi:hypothetical protein OG871_06085 [Kitasatospora sp. NBC_00374]|uniref:hypothetical protein n=1 Tax=Kitasatospora sp. NBC_00374 TaxID=2975964 RepID=UPI00324E94E8
MPRLIPVIARVAPEYARCAAWPTAAQGDPWLPLHGSMTPEEVGAAVYSVVFHGVSGAMDQADLPRTPAAALELLDGFEEFYAPGGLLVHDPGRGVLVEPGCCCDLFEWRDWLAALDGGPVDLGHDPGPWIEYPGGGAARVWAWGAEDSAGRPTPVPHVDLSRDALPGLLCDAQRDLAGFLPRLRAWALTLVPDRADHVVAAFDRGLAIGEPLPAVCGGAAR